MIEYTIVSTLLSLVVWYALFGGSGYWLDPDKVANQGNLSSKAPVNTPDSIINSLNDRQHDFARDIYRP